MPKTDILVLVFALSVLSDTVTYGLDGNGSSNRICNAVLSFCFVEIVADPDLVLFAKLLSRSVVDGRNFSPHWHILYP